MQYDSTEKLPGKCNYVIEKEISDFCCYRTTATSCFRNSFLTVMNQRDDGITRDHEANLTIEGVTSHPV
jgi:hypothetical protein